MSDDVKAVAKEILDRTEGQIGTHSTDCHKYHLACFAAFVMRNMATSEQTPDFSALLSDEAVAAAKRALKIVGFDGAHLIDARLVLQAAVDAVSKGDAE